MIIRWRRNFFKCLFPWILSLDSKTWLKFKFAQFQISKKRWFCQDSLESIPELVRLVRTCTKGREMTKGRDMTNDSIPEAENAKDNSAQFQ